MVLCLGGFLVNSLETHDWNSCVSLLLESLSVLFFLENIEHLARVFKITWDIGDTVTSIFFYSFIN